MAKRTAVWLSSEELLTELKTRARTDQCSVRDVVLVALRAYLGAAACPMCRRPFAKPVVPPAPPLVVPSFPTGPVVAPPPVAAVEPTCRRCGHQRSQHWAKGCVATCNCSEARYRA